MQYNRSAISDRPAVTKILHEALSHMEYVNSRISIVGLLLFGPEKDRSTLRAVRSPDRVVDDWQYLDSTVHFYLLFYYIYGVIICIC